MSTLSRLLEGLSWGGGWLFPIEFYKVCNQRIFFILS